MKKKIFVILIMMFLIPKCVSGLTFDLESKVNLLGRQISNGDFTFELRDYKGNLISTTTNDKDGNILFKNIETYGQNTNYNIFMINMKDKNNDLYDIDKETIYVGVYFNNNGITEIDYLKGTDNHYFKPAKTNKSIYHAKDNDLSGVAYAVIDISTGILTIFRDDAGKYSNGQVISEKIYYTGIEDYGNVIDLTYKGLVNKIVVENPIKPRSLNNFSNMPNLVSVEGFDKIDTSLVTSFSGLFNNDSKLKSIDLSTWDTSNVTNMNGMFNGCISLESVYLDNFDTRNVTTMFSMFNNTVKLKGVNIDSFDLSNVVNAYNIFQKSGVESIDFSKINHRDDINLNGVAINSEGVRYIDFSNITRITSSEFSDTKCLNIIKLVSDRKSLYQPDANSDHRYFLTSIDQHSSLWYLPKDKEVFLSSNITEYLSDGVISNGVSTHPDAVNGYLYGPYDTSILIRPICNQNIEEFVVNYKDIQLSKNPKTGQTKIIVLIIIISSILVIINISKKIRNI